MEEVAAETTPAVEAEAEAAGGAVIACEPALDDVCAALQEGLEAFVTETGAVPEVAGRILTALQLPETYLPTVDPAHAAVAAARAALSSLLDASMSRPKQLVDLFTTFEVLATTDPDGYAAALKEKHPTLAQYSAEIKKWSEMASAVRAAAPSDVHCRLLRVHCGELQAELVERAENLRAVVAGLVVDELQEKAAEIGASYESIHARLQQASTNAEEATELQSFLKSSEAELFALQSSIQSDLVGRHELLTTFSAALPDAVFAAVYATAGWPVRVEKVAEQAAVRMDEDRATFQEALRVDTETFRDELEVWEGEIKALASLGDLAEVEANAATVQALAEKLAAGKERAALCNSREVLFGWEQTEWPQLAELHASLEPHVTLWQTAQNFQRSFPQWMEGPILELQPEQVEKDVGDWWRALYKLGKALAGLDGPLRVVASVKAKLDEFKAHLPLLHALLNPGMRERHWRRLAEQLGRSVQPNEMATLSSMLEQQVGEHLSAIELVSETASKEYSLEKALDKMLADWKPIAFECVGYRDSGTFILRSLDEIQSLFDDHIVKTQAMRRARTSSRSRSGCASGRRG